MARHREEQASLSSDLVGLCDWLCRPATEGQKWTHAGIDLKFVDGDRDVFICFSRGRDGGLALRIPKLVGPGRLSQGKAAGQAIAAWSLDGDAGRLDIELSGEPTGQAQFRCRVTVTPRVPLRLAAQPRDLIAFGRSNNPVSAKGMIEAAQRKLNTGLVYFSLERPALGKVLYVQDLTALNPYFAATGTKPESAVGGEWPELGYRMPVNPEKALPAGEVMVLYDSHLVIRQFAEAEEADSAWQFLDMLAAVYRRIERPGTELRPWIDRSRRTLRDLEKADKTRVWHAGEVYFHPYTAAEYPDSMVQLSLLSAIDDWGRWQGRRHPLRARIFRGLKHFYDPRLAALRRYLPDVGKEKNADAVDSWYLYHPMLNLSNLALAGDDKARDLFLKTVDFGIRAARHFRYRWPIQFDATDFTVITKFAEADQLGQTDVGGIYAWVMLQGFQMTGETRFIDEARAALDAARGLRFELNYQANLTAWGAAACIRLWRITEEKTYLALSYAYLASFFHNAQLWESEIGHAAHYSNFMGVTCLQDAPYMAIYECFDSFAAFERYLDLGGPDLITSVRLLVSEYCRYSLHRAWSYYPDALPKEALAEKQRNGEIDPALSYPLEDLYPDGQPAGQVGQEIYGAGAAMAFATRAFHRIEGAPFTLFSDHFLRALTRIDERGASFRIEGEDGGTARLVMLKERRKKLPEVVLSTLAGAAVKPASADGKCIAFDLPAKIALELRW